MYHTQAFKAPYLAVNLTACVRTDGTYVYGRRSLKAHGAFTDQQSWANPLCLWDSRSTLGRDVGEGWGGGALRGSHQLLISPLRAGGEGTSPCQ